MRKILFRAWDERKKLMHFNFQFIKSGESGNDWIIFSSDKHNKYDEYIKNPYFRQQLKIMQFTGLKDKHGKDIYESDIVKWFFDGQYKWNAQIIFEKGSFCHCSYPYLYDDKTNDSGYARQPLWNFGMQFDEYEVIGNIFENSGLLEESK